MTTFDDLVRERDQFRTEATNLLTRAGDADLSGEDAARFDQLTAEIEDRNGKIREMEDRNRRAADLLRAVRDPNGRVRLEGEADRVSPYGRDEDSPPVVRQRDDAMRTLDRATKAGKLEARGAELVENLMRTGPAPSQSWTQRYAVAAGSEAYERAFAKLVANPTQGHLEWTADEGDAYRAVAAVQAEQRAMSTTDTGGGYLIPLTLDPAVMLTSSGSINPLRQISRVVQTVTDTWQGVTSAGADGRVDCSRRLRWPTRARLWQPVDPRLQGWCLVPFSFEVQGDAVNFMQELGKLLVDGAEQLNATAYTTGSGSGQPKGIITSLVGSAGTVPLITPGRRRRSSRATCTRCRTRSHRGSNRTPPGPRTCRSSTRCVNSRQPMAH